MRKKNDEASALWLRFYSGEITAAEYAKSYPLPILLEPAECRNPPHRVPDKFRDRWVANETTVWEPEGA
jgi:hypothetical protein